MNTATLMHKHKRRCPKGVVKSGPRKNLCRMKKRKKRS